MHQPRHEEGGQHATEAHRLRDGWRPQATRFLPLLLWPLLMRLLLLALPLLLLLLLLQWPLLSLL